jgi:hypothetical protein
MVKSGAMRPTSISAGGAGMAGAAVAGAAEVACATANDGIAIKAAVMTEIVRLFIRTPLAVGAATKKSNVLRGRSTNAGFSFSR